MLEHLRVRNLGVIDDVSMDLSEGFVVISGETGAGKTLLTSGLSFLLGSKLSKVAENRDTLVEALIYIDDGQHHIKRELKASGRSRCYLDSDLISTSELREFMQSHIEIFGQNLAVSLQHPNFQLKMLDRAGQVDLRSITLLRTKLSNLQRERDELLELISKVTEAQDERATAISELERCGLSDPDEDSALQEQIEIASHSEQIRLTLRDALVQLDSDGSNSILDQIAQLVRTLTKLPSSVDVLRRVQNSLIELTDVKSELIETLMELESDDGHIEQLQERLYLLNGIKRKYGASLRELLDLRESYKRQLSESQDLFVRANDIDKDIDSIQRQLSQEEESVRMLRSSTSLRLKKELEDLLVDLGLARTQLEFLIASRGDGSPVQTMLSTNPGSPLRPLGEAASGGELSRIMLALCRVLGSDATTLIFDEIDAGVGGETALRVARSLKALSEEKQVVVVTHLAQVASFASQHFIVEKEQGEVSTRTIVKELVAYDSRVEEISRMLSGQRDSDAAKTHADELLRMGAGTRI